MPPHDPNTHTVTPSPVPPIHSPCRSSQLLGVLRREPTASPEGHLIGADGGVHGARLKALEALLEWPTISGDVASEALKHLMRTPLWAVRECTRQCKGRCNPHGHKKHCADECKRSCRATNEHSSLLAKLVRRAATDHGHSLHDYVAAHAHRTHPSRLRVALAGAAAAVRPTWAADGLLLTNSWRQQPGGGSGVGSSGRGNSSSVSELAHRLYAAAARRVAGGAHAGGLTAAVAELRRQHASKMAAAAVGAEEEEEEEGQARSRPGRTSAHYHQSSPLNGVGGGGGGGLLAAHPAASFDPKATNRGRRELSLIDWSSVNFDDFSLTFIDIILSHPPLDWDKT